MYISRAYAKRRQVLATTATEGSRGALVTQIFAAKDVKCPFSATIEFIERLHRTGSDHVIGPLARLRTPVVCNLHEVRDFTDETRIHEALVLHWKARANIPVPEMNGLLTVRPNGPLTQLRMEGQYEPPLGLPGRLFDALVGRHIARRTISLFLAELRTFIEAEWEKERVSDAARIEGT